MTDAEHLVAEAARAVAIGADASAMVFVEGTSDQVAIHTLARRLGRDLAAERIVLVPIGGASAIGTFLRRFGPQGCGVRVAGLCDEAEVGDYLRGLQRAGLGSGLLRTDLEALGFFVCVADLEDELVRALGVAGVEQVIADHGELASLRIVQQQPAQRDRPPAAVLRRFLGSRSGRKVRYARWLVEALPIGDAPAPLTGLLTAL